MADVLSSYYGGNARLNARVPGTGGMGAQTSASVGYIRGLDALARAGGTLANAYVDAIIARDTRDAETEISRIFRERRVHILQTTKGKQADGLLDREDTWQRERYEEFKENTKLEPIVTREIWYKYSKQYLDRTGSYMVEQQALYDKQSRLAASDEINDRMVMTDIGDIEALSSAFERNGELFVNDPMMAEKQNDKAIMTAMSAWTRQNPRATIQWFNANKETLKERFGAKYINVSDMVDRAERKIQAEAAHAETIAARADRLRAKQDKAYSEGVLSDFLTLLARDEANADALYAITDDPRVSASNKLTAYNAFKGMEKAERAEANAEKKASQENIENDLGARVIANGWDNTVEDIMRHASNGDIPYEAMKRLVNLREDMAKVPAETKPFITNAETFVSEMYAGKQDMFSMPDPAKVEQKNRMVGAIRRRAFESPSTVAKDFDINDPNSWISQLVRANPTIKPNFNAGASPFDASPSPVTIIQPGLNNRGLPGAIGATIPAPVSTSSRGPLKTSHSTPEPASTGNQVLDRLRARGIKPRSQRAVQ